MKQSITHIIWDFNGTLLCDAQLSVDTDNAVFDKLGLPHITLEDYRRNMTMPVRDFYLALGVDYSVHSYELISRLWLDIFNAHAVDAGLVPGILPVVDAASSAGLTQSVLSASYELSLRRQCDALGLTARMAAIDGLEDESARRKTDIGRRQMRRLGLNPGATLLVGDMVADAQLAAELGIDCVLVAWGHNDLARLAATGLPVAHTPQELERLLLGRADRRGDTHG